MLHQRKNLTTKEFQIGREIEECQLQAVATGFLELQESLHDLRWASDNLHIPANRPIGAEIGLPALRVAAQAAPNKSFDRFDVGGRHD